MIIINIHEVCSIEDLLEQIENFLDKIEELLERSSFAASEFDQKLRRKNDFNSRISPYTKDDKFFKNQPIQRFKDNRENSNRAERVGAMFPN